MNEVKEASQKQLKWLRDLLESKDYSQFPEAWRGWCDTIRAQFAACVGEGYDPGALNTWLLINGRIPVSHADFQRALPKLQEAPKAYPIDKVALDIIRANQPAAEVEDGVYKVGQAIFKVKHSQTGKQWAHKLVVDSDRLNEKGGHVAGKFVYAGTVARNGITPDHKLTYESAKEFGALYGVCCCCGRLLTNELSIHLGIGPVCGDREFGGEFKILVEAAKLAVSEQEL